jgi:hypothetical protein
LENTSFTSKLFSGVKTVCSYIWSNVVNAYKGIPIVSADTLGILGIMVLHSTTIPSLLALLNATSDALPSIDVVAFIWAGLLLLFVRSFILKEMIGIFTNFAGFFVQACLLGLLLFK